MNIDHLREWLGKTESSDDQVTATPIAALSATLNREHAAPQAGDPLPPLWHWLYFLPIHRQDQLGAGRPSAARRLPAAGALAAPHVGRQPAALPPSAAQRRTRSAALSRIVDVSHKQGRSGPLVFVLVRHEISNRAGVAISEEHDIVYRDNPHPDDPRAESRSPRPADAAWSRKIEPDDVLLFRYSALTFNGHRIHYDRRYVTEVEGYPGLVVHGPLIATLLMDLLCRNLPAARRRGLPVPRGQTAVRYRAVFCLRQAGAGRQDHPPVGHGRARCADDGRHADAGLNAPLPLLLTIGIIHMQHIA